MNRKNRKWEDWEIRYLEDNYETGSMTVIEMADRIGRTYGAVLTEAKKLGLKRKRKSYPQQFRNGAEEYPPREVQDATYTNVCVYVLEGKSYEYIAKELKRPAEQIKEIYETAVKSGRLAAIKESRSGRYINALSPHYPVPKGFKWQGVKPNKE